MSNRVAMLVLAASASLALCGCSVPCGLVAHGTDPRPATFLERHDARIALLLPPGPKSDFRAQGGYAVTDFVDTLSRGFAAGFGDAYIVSHQDPDRYLELSAVEVWFESGWRFDVAHVRYRARLLDRDHCELGRYAGDARSRRTCSDDCTSSLESAIETMYEEIADHLFWEKGESASAAT